MFSLSQGGDYPEGTSEKRMQYYLWIDGKFVKASRFVGLSFFSLEAFVEVRVFK